MDLGRSSAKLFLSQAGRAAILFLGIVYFARRLGPEQLGSFFLFQALMGLLVIPADFGVRGALEKRLSEGVDRSEFLGSALLLKAVLLAVVSLCILIVRPHVNRYLGIDLAVFLVLSVVAFECSGVFVQTLRGELRVGETAIIKLVRRFVWVGLGAVLIELGYGVVGLVVGLICAGTITALWAFARCETPVGRPRVESIRSLFVYAKFQAVTSVGGRVYQWIDIAIVGLFLANQYVSSYEVSWQVTLLVLLVSKSIGWSIFPQISRWHVQSEIEAIEATVSRGMAFALFVSIPALVGGAIFAPDILRLLFGPEYAIASTVLVVLLVEKLFQSVNDIVESAVRALDRPDMAAKATVVTVGLNVVLNPLLVLWIGFVGAAIATALSWLVNTALHTYYLNRLISVEFPVRVVGSYVASSIVMASLLVVVRSSVPVTSVPTLFALVCVGGVAYVTAASAVPAVRQQILLPAIRTFV